MAAQNDLDTLLQKLESSKRISNKTQKKAAEDELESIIEQLTTKSLVPKRLLNSEEDSPQSEVSTSSTPASSLSLSNSFSDFSWSPSATATPPPSPASNLSSKSSSKSTSQVSSVSSSVDSSPSVQKKLDSKIPVIPSEEPLSEAVANLAACAGCGLPIGDSDAVQANKLAWHLYCLKCSSCRTSLQNQKFIPYGNRKILCTTCGMRWLHESGNVR